MMQGSEVIVWWIAFMALSLFFSGMEVAFVASDKLRHAVTKKEKGAYNFMLNTLYRHPRQFLSTLAVAKVIVLVFFVYFTLLIARQRVFYPEAPAGWILPLVILFVASLMLLTDEFIPRVVFKKNPNVWVHVLAVPAFLFYVLLYPVAKAFVGLSKGALSLFGIRSAHSREQTYGRVDLDAYVKKSIDQMMLKEGDVDPEVKIFRNALDFTTTKLRDCMVP